MTDTYTAIFETVNRKRKTWTPMFPVTKESARHPGAADVISKCLALRILELPVRSFILDGLSRPEASKLGELGQQCLMRNTLDEEKHDIALTNCLSVYKDYNSKFEQEAETILKVWSEHPDHPITKTLVLENGIFFIILPLYNRYGHQSLRLTSLDISSDEVNHVQSHRAAIRLMNMPPSASLNKLRRMTVDWIVSGLDVENDSPERYLESSDSLMYRGVAEQLNFTKTYTVPAFFETSNDNLPYYN